MQGVGTGIDADCPAVAITDAQVVPGGHEQRDSQTDYRQQSHGHVVPAPVDTDAMEAARVKSLIRALTVGHPPHGGLVHPGGQHV